MVGSVRSKAPGPRVLVVLDESMGWLRGVLRGFTEVARARNWTLLHYHAPADVRWLVELFGPKAVVMQGAPKRDAAEVLSSCTVVSVNDDQSTNGMASICLDERKIGELAAVHLIEKGFRALSTFRFNDETFAVSREQAFRETATLQGARLVPGWWDQGTDPPRWAEVPSAFIGWLLGLPRPCGVFACTDRWSSVVARYAHLAGVRIPEDIALIGVDNDILDCELSSPPLTSVAVPWRSMGAQAATLVGQALSGLEIAGQRMVISPVGVVPRRSTDVTVVDDPVVARAISWIRERVDRPLTLQSIARASSCSRQRLEHRFRAAIGRTVMQEARRARVEVARRLLSTTDLPLPSVARQCGFTSAVQLCVGFRRETGMPPGAYRRLCRRLSTSDE